MNRNKVSVNFQILILFALLVGSCKSTSTSPTNNSSGSGGGGGAPQITATIDGKTIVFTPVFHSGTYYGNTPFGPSLSLAIEGTADAPPRADISLSGGGTISTGTFDIGSDAHSNYSFSLTYSYDTTIEGVTGNYHYSSEGSNGVSCGTITISSISSSGVQGSFEARLPAGVARDTTPASISAGTFYIGFSN